MRILPTLVTLVWLPRAARDFDALREPYRTQVDLMLTRYVLYGEGDVRPVETKPGLYRLKSRSHRAIYRVTFAFAPESLVLFAIERRDKAYKEKA